jgi:hypothetical protein
MEAAAFFLLIVALLVFAAGGTLLAGVALRLRRAKLDPEEDKLERPAGEKRQPDADAPGRRPEHVRVDSEQRADYVGER